MEQEHYYAIETKDNELKHYGVKGMHWGIRRYQPYTSNPRKGGKTGKFVGNKPKARVVKDDKGSVAALAVGLAAATAIGVKAAKAVAEKRKMKNAVKRKEKQDAIDKQKGKDGVEYMKIKLPENAQKDIANSAKKLRDAEKEMDDLYWKIEDGTALKDKTIRPKYDKAQKKYEEEFTKYQDTLHKWDFDIDGETEYSYDFQEELIKQYSNSKSGAVKDSKGSAYTDDLIRRLSTNIAANDSKYDMSQRTNRHRNLPGSENTKDYLHSTDKYNKPGTTRGRDGTRSGSSAEKLSYARDEYERNRDASDPETLSEAWKKYRLRRK